MKKIYVILMHTRTIPARLIKIFTHYEYSHVCISLDKRCDEVYSFGRKRYNSIIDSGFCLEYKNGEFFSKFNKTRCKIYEIEVTDKQYQKVIKIIDYMKKNADNYKYDYFGLIIRFFGIPVTIKNRYVCSYFVAYILKEARICKFKKDVCLIKPRDFTKLDKLKEIYKGRYELYES